MSGLNGILNTGKSGLLASQTALSVVANNATNANTPEFARRDIHWNNVDPGGVEISAVTRRTESFLGGKILRERAGLGAEQSKSSSLQAIEGLFTEGDGSLGAQLDAFFNSLRALQTDPTDQQLRLDLLAKGDTLCQTVATFSQALSSERSQADQQLDSMVARVNTLTTRLAALNGDIVQLEAGSGEASALRDERDRLVAELGGLVEISTFEDDAGQLTVILAGSRSIVQESSASTLRATSDVAYAGFRRIDVVDPGGLATDFTSQLRRGQIGGILELRDDIVPSLATEMDQFAYDLVTNFNGLHNAGYGTDGNDGRNFFQQPMSPAGAAAGMSIATGLAGNPAWIAASTDVNQAVGGNDNLLALADLETQLLAGGNTRTFAEQIAELTAEVGRVVQSNQTGLDQAARKLDQLQALKSSTVGVSMDEELVDLTRFQRAFQANARVIQLVDELFQTVLQI